MPAPGATEAGEREHTMQCTHTHERGFTLVELMVACAVLIIGVVSIAPLIATSARTDSTMRNDSIAVSTAEREMERIKALDFTSTSLADGGSTLDSSGKISFSGSGVTNYSTTVSLADSDQIGKTVTFDVRWNITSVTGSSGSLKQITLAAQRSGGNWRYPAVQLTTYRTK